MSINGQLFIAVYLQAKVIDYAIFALIYPVFPVLLPYSQ
ncbi:hypothetical protein GNIT_1248 [Glaciecola nitratireducens FR1064]|uniref:Uncharacterized protein n=1 Tax=Glaciecola nitratireducens (strain JCM 12485 / KCTC 12276 / FR1064) TaxID=1085623 RepID=G4QKY2_GLANF|nr:hypothetical protein GNIT_1248 [Glaciecola nitratireducens FR1064]